MAFGMQQTGYQIGGNLPWGSGGAGLAFGGSPQDLAASYGRSYADALNMNKQNYANIMAGYQQTLAQQQQQQQNVAQGYSNLYESILGEIKGIGASREQGINDAYAQQLGRGTQSLIDRGLGNSTVTSSLARGVEADRQKQLTALANDLAGMQAGYHAQLGGAASQYLGQAQRDNSALAQQQLRFMADLQAPYPDAALYASLARQAGGGPGGAAGRFGMTAGGPGAGGGGYVPAGGGFSRSVNWAPNSPAFDAMPAGYGYAGAPAAGGIPAGYGDPYAQAGHAGAENNALAGVIGYAPAAYAQPEGNALAGVIGYGAANYAAPAAGGYAPGLTDLAPLDLARQFGLGNY